jgi:valyl-tRNA synthetase
VLDQSMILLHPFMPFITEELWGTTGKREKLLVHTDWPTLPETLTDAEADREMSFVTTLIDDIRSARAQMHVPVGIRVELLYDTEERSAESQLRVLGYLDRNRALIQRLARVDYRAVDGQFPKGSISIAVEGAAFAIPLAGVIDIAEEKSRLQKAQDKLAKEISGLKGRLDNPNFARSAPEDVVMEARSNLEAREEEAAKIGEALKRLADLG